MKGLLLAHTSTNAKQVFNMMSLFITARQVLYDRSPVSVRGHLRGSSCLFRSEVFIHQHSPNDNNNNTNMKHIKEI